MDGLFETGSALKGDMIVDLLGTIHGHQCMIFRVHAFVSLCFYCRGFNKKRLQWVWGVGTVFSYV